MIGAKPLRIRSDKVDGFIRVYDWTRYLALFGPGKYDVIYNRIRYLINQKSGVILTKSVFNKNQNCYYYNIFLGKCSYQLAEKK